MNKKRFYLKSIKVILSHLKQWAGVACNWPLVVSDVMKSFANLSNVLPNARTLYLYLRAIQDSLSFMLSEAVKEWVVEKINKEYPVNVMQLS